MAKVKLTKNALKAERDSLKRYQRYLPTLLLKKQQLQMEMRTLQAKVMAKRDEEDALRKSIAGWIGLYAEPIEWDKYISVKEIRQGEGNIAGVEIPLFDGVDFNVTIPDFFTTPAWLDEGIRSLQGLISLRLERRVLEKQYELLSDELRSTSQRVNLFEKVKIPEAKENIRTINIFLSDQQISGVARSKLAKGKANARVLAQEGAAA
ncbi:MAG: V-type ATP synthase subunit D [Fibrobacter sp.]|jgi:V/A-type H+-transporting ATPase subunit D|nr:V-type ATP synthase subunit D [Fibrobacter sp.]MDY6284122.1 V-type ATP synthase subunit D [Fibrobacter sp.]MDY6370166.1 V-type ATP synthase subunit D [Fibrobacter sp.]MDY6391090.1 V-type ATP synthase subunit D [Fibrobacter sp.]